MTSNHLQQGDPTVYEWLNPILLRRSQQIILPVPAESYPLSEYTNKDQIQPGSESLMTTGLTSSADIPLIAALLQNIEQLGYTFSPELLQTCYRLSREQIIHLHAQLVPVLQKMLGAHVEYKPMYPNFPDQVMDASEAELYLNAVIHYATGALPATAQRPRPLNLDHDLAKLKPIRLTHLQEGLKWMSNLAAANGSLSEQDKADLETALRYSSELEQWLPEEIPYKENAAFIAAVLLNEGRANIHQLTRYFRTATDVLRLAAGLSGLDTSLSWARKLPQLTRPFHNVFHLTQGLNVPNHSNDTTNDTAQVSTDLVKAYYFRKFKRSERRLLLGLLDRTIEPLEDMLLYREQWKRLGEILHPGEMKERYPSAFEAFTRLRREKHIATFRSEVEEGLRSGDPAVIARLASRPGELARRMDYLLRSQPEHSQIILNSFASGAAQMAVPLLLQVMAHFKYRHESRRYRVFFPKGNMGKVIVVPNRLPKLNMSYTGAIVQIIEQELRQRFADREPLGKVYIDPRLMRIPVPFDQRSASNALRPLPRGSRIDVPSGDTIRLFCWWKNIQNDSPQGERTDIDLSVVLMDKQWNPVETLAFYNLKEAYGAHSGDIVDAPQGASEFIDLNIPAILDSTYARYAVVQVACFTGQAFAELPECFVGFMMRQYSQTGEIYDPRTVESRFDLTVEAQQAVTFAIDLQQREMIWMDAVLKNRSIQITAEQNMTGLQMLGHAFSNLRKTTLAELFTLHAEARGTLTDCMEEADTIFDMEQGVTPYQIDLILKDYV